MMNVTRALHTLLERFLALNLLHHRQKLYVTMSSFCGTHVADGQCLACIQPVSSPQFSNTGEAYVTLDYVKLLAPQVLPPDTVFLPTM